MSPPLPSWVAPHLDSAIPYSAEEFKKSMAEIHEKMKELFIKHREHAAYLYGFKAPADNVKQELAKKKDELLVLRGQLNGCQALVDAIWNRIHALQPIQEHSKAIGSLKTVQEIIQDLVEDNLQMQTLYKSPKYADALTEFKKSVEACRNAKNIKKVTQILAETFPKLELQRKNLPELRDKQLVASIKKVHIATLEIFQSALRRFSYSSERIGEYVNSWSKEIEEVTLAPSLVESFRVPEVANLREDLSFQHLLTWWEWTFLDYDIKAFSIIIQTLTTVAKKGQYLDETLQMRRSQVWEETQAPQDLDLLLHSITSLKNEIRIQCEVLNAIDGISNGHLALFYASRLNAFLEELERKYRGVAALYRENSPIAAGKNLFSCLATPSQNSEQSLARLKGLFEALSTLQRLDGEKKAEDPLSRALVRLAKREGIRASLQPFIPSKEALSERILLQEDLDSFSADVVEATLLKEIIAALFSAEEYSKEPPLFDLILFNLQDVAIYSDRFSKSKMSPTFQKALEAYLSHYPPFEEELQRKLSLLFSNLIFCEKSSDHFDTIFWFGQSAIFLQELCVFRDHESRVQRLLEFAKTKFQRIQKLYLYPSLIEDDNRSLKSLESDESYKSALFSALVHAFWSKSPKLKTQAIKKLRRYFAEMRPELIIIPDQMKMFQNALFVFVFELVHTQSKESQIIKGFLSASLPLLGKEIFQTFLSAYNSTLSLFEKRIFQNMLSEYIKNPSIRDGLRAQYGIIWCDGVLMVMEAEMHRLGDSSLGLILDEVRTESGKEEWIDVLLHYEKLIANPNPQDRVALLDKIDKPNLSMHKSWKMVLEAISLDLKENDFCCVESQMTPFKQVKNKLIDSYLQDEEELSTEEEAIFEEKEDADY